MGRVTLGYSFIIMHLLGADKLNPEDENNTGGIRLDWEAAHMAVRHIICFTDYPLEFHIA